ncbi:unnamed protein product [Symbiodinium natans]|uniref:Uncharacterized protein n=1 Tax=Symbiodinium natans TaxID=878477 RepID=A0A812V6T6_9DINO|nr:unnamed protein product [Symbiodinium natans]
MFTQVAKARNLRRFNALTHEALSSCLMFATLTFATLQVQVAFTFIHFAPASEAPLRKSASAPSLLTHAAHVPQCFGVRTDLELAKLDFELYTSVQDLARRCSGYAEAQARHVLTVELCVNAWGELLWQYLHEAQDAGLSALAAYLENCPQIADRGNEVLPWVRKLSGHKTIDKPTMQQLAPTIILLIAEIVANCWQARHVFFWGRRAKIR